MDRQTQLDVIAKYTEERHEVMKGKGEDYANEADVLANFKYVAMANGRKASNVILDEVHKKVLRLQNLMQGKTPKNESIRDSVLDLSNYSDLLICALHDEEVKEPAPTPLKKRFIVEPKKAKHEELWKILNGLSFDGAPQFISDYRIDSNRTTFGQHTYQISKPNARLIPMELIVKFPTVIGEDNTYFLTEGDIDINRLIKQLSK